MKVLKKIFGILEFTASSPHGAGDIASHLDLPRPTCARLLKQLLDAGYLQKTLDGKQYMPGPMGFQVFTAESDYLLIRNISASAIEELAKYSHGNAMISILEGSYRYILFMHNTSSVIKSIIKLKHDDIYQSISGRVNLAHASKQEQEKTIKRLGMPGQEWNDIKDMKSLQAELQKIRKSPIHELVKEEHYLTFAAPVKIQGKTAVIGLVSELVPDAEKLKKLRAKIIETVKEIQDLSKERFILP